MSKPGFFFYTGDWIKKTRSLSLQAKGAWIELLVIMDECKPRGVLEWSIEQYARFFSVSPEVAGGVLAELESTKVADVIPSLVDVTFALPITRSNFKVTVISRRMKREEKNKKANRLRQARFKKKRIGNASGNAKIQLPSSSSSLSSSSSSDSYKNKNPNPATPEPSVDSSKTEKKSLDPAVKQWTDKIYALDHQKFGRLIAWATAALRSYSVPVVATSLERFYPFAADVREWWPYLDKILDKTETKTNARDSEAESERRKQEEADYAKAVYGGRGLRTKAGP